jgi:hypothetical protein
MLFSASIVNVVIGFLLCRQWFAVKDIHRSTRGHKQVISFANVLNLQGLAGGVHRLASGRVGGGFNRLGDQIQKCHPSRSHLFQIALRSKSRFAPSQTQTHFGSRDYEFPVAQASTET